MDNRHFDQLVRSLAGGVSRRGLVRAFVGSLTGTALAIRGDAASAKPDRRPCREAGKRCGVGGLDAERCCSGVCCGRACCGEGEACTGVECCPLLRACGDLCCPPESTGCTVDDSPSGPVFGCLCPEGTLYDREANACRPCQGIGDSCAVNGDCCAETCCNGVCCAAGEVCSDDGRCVDPKCCSGIARCGRHVSDGMCCAAPLVAMCCCDSNGNDGWVRCCTPGVDCDASLCPHGSARASMSPDCSVDVTDEVTEHLCCEDLGKCCHPETGDALGHYCLKEGEVCEDEVCRQWNGGICC